MLRPDPEGWQSFGQAVIIALEKAMTPVKEYKAYRRAYRELNHKIMKKYLKNDQLLGSAKMLGITHVIVWN